MCKMYKSDLFKVVKFGAQLDSKIIQKNENVNKKPAC